MCFEDGGGGHKPRNTSGPWKPKKAQILPSQPPEDAGPTDILSSVKPISDFRPPEPEENAFVLLKPLSVW